MPTAFLAAWFVATVALALYLVGVEQRDEARRLAPDPDDVQPRPERGLAMTLVEGVFMPILLALLISAIVGGIVGVALKVLST